MRYELTDLQWSAIKPFLPNKPRGVPRVNDRRVRNGIFCSLAPDPRRDEGNPNERIRIPPGGRAHKFLRSMAFLTMFRRLKRTDITAHVFRSTFRDWRRGRVV
jgi:hypothetical protein